MLLPGSLLTTEQLIGDGDDMSIELQLLSMDSSKLQLKAEQIGKFWHQLPYWAFAWAAGQGLAAYLLQNPELVKGKRVLDFGCGSGLVGIAAAKAGAKSVVCCDTDGLALLAVQENAQRNNVVIETMSDWSTCNDSFDCLLAADVLYDLTSVGDLSKQCKAIPNWIVAETQYQLPPWSSLEKVANNMATTLPLLDDFDQNLIVSIYKTTSISNL
jgi:predicted nicotinamide N-methyase